MGRSKSGLTHDLFNDGLRRFSSRLRASFLVGNLVEKHFGRQVVALLHHRLKDIRHRAFYATYLPSRSRTHLFARSSIDKDACTAQLTQETDGKVVLLVQQQRREHRILVVPAPAFAIEFVVLEGIVGHDIPTDGVNTQCLDRIDKRFQVVKAKAAIHTAYTIEVPHQRPCLGIDGTRIAQARLQLIVSPQQIKGGNGRDKFLSAGGTHTPPLMITEQARISREVPHHKSHLSRLQQRRLKDLIQLDGQWR